ncbi:hypothetical protein ACERZ8_06190 [Tateyamaria armeniaca]|uniref:SAF domain-containing protein n=1 Tax=Tateyamaria armeniaca TaxID=2518930 RepID=A0ABW8UQU3_9RHOB
MLKKILPIVLVLVGVGAGVAAGVFLRPEEIPVAVETDADKASIQTGPSAEAEALSREYVKMNNQFVVPVVRGESVQALVVLSLSLEVPAGQKDAIYSREPKLRDLVFTSHV